MSKMIKMNIYAKSKLGSGLYLLYIWLVFGSCQADGGELYIYSSKCINIHFASTPATLDAASQNPVEALVYE